MTPYSFNGFRRQRSGGTCSKQIDFRIFSNNSKSIGGDSPAATAFIKIVSTFAFPSRLLQVTEDGQPNRSQLLKLSAQTPFEIRIRGKENSLSGMSGGRCCSRYRHQGCGNSASQRRCIGSKTCIRSAPPAFIDSKRSCPGQKSRAETGAACAPTGPTAAGCLEAIAAEIHRSRRTKVATCCNTKAHVRSQCFRRYVAGRCR